jgi:hypothetical protein
VNDEAILVVVILAGIAGMIVVLVRYQRGKEARLAALTEIEIPIASTLRTVLVVLPSIAVSPVLMAVLGAMTDPWLRHHALAATLTGIGVGVVGLFVGLRVSRRFCRIGLLRYTPVSLDLELGDERRHIDLDEPYELAEGMAWGPANMPLQVLSVRQGDRHWGFSYGLPLGRKPYGDGGFDRYLTPLVNGEARVIHDRLRARVAGAAS